MALPRHARNLRFIEGLGWKPAPREAEEIAALPTVEMVTRLRSSGFVMLWSALLAAARCLALGPQAIQVLAEFTRPAVALARHGAHFLGDRRFPLGTGQVVVRLRFLGPQRTHLLITRPTVTVNRCLSSRHEAGL